MDDVPNFDEAKKRGVLQRVVVGAVWLVVICVVVVEIVGGIAGLTAKSSGGGFDAGILEGQAAAKRFFEDYGVFVYSGALAFATLLVWKGNLPGMGKCKVVTKVVRQERNLKSPSPSRHFPTWLRVLLVIVLIGVASGIWNFLTVIIGAPHSVTLIGTMVILFGGVAYMFRGGA